MPKRQVAKVEVSFYTVEDRLVEIKKSPKDQLDLYIESRQKVQGLTLLDFDGFALAVEGTRIMFKDEKIEVAEAERLGLAKQLQTLEDSGVQIPEGIFYPDEAELEAALTDRKPKKRSDAEVYFDDEKGRFIEIRKEKESGRMDLFIDGEAKKQGLTLLDFDDGSQLFIERLTVAPESQSEVREQLEALQEAGAEVEDGIFFPDAKDFEEMQEERRRDEARGSRSSRGMRKSLGSAEPLRDEDPEVTFRDAENRIVDVKKTVRGELVMYMDDRLKVQDLNYFNFDGTYLHFEGTRILFGDSMIRVAPEAAEKRRLIKQLRNINSGRAAVDCIEIEDIVDRGKHGR